MPRKSAGSQEIFRNPKPLGAQNLQQRPQHWPKRRMRSQGAPFGGALRGVVGSKPFIDGQLKHGVAGQVAIHGGMTERPPGITVEAGCELYLFFFHRDRPQSLFCTTFTVDNIGASGAYFNHPVTSNVTNYLKKITESEHMTLPEIHDILRRHKRITALASHLEVSRAAVIRALQGLSPSRRTEAAALAWAQKLQRRRPLSKP
jgi:hypothetical protein